MSASVRVLVAALLLAAALAAPARAADPPVSMSRTEALDVLRSTC